LEIVKAIMQGVQNIGCASIAKPHSKALIQGFIIIFFGSPDGKKAGIHRCKELMRDWSLCGRVRPNVIHSEK